MLLTTALMFTIKETPHESIAGETHILVKSLIYFAYFAMFLASLFGNSVIIHIIRTDNSMKTTTNYLILNQACADLLFTFAEFTNFFVPTNYLGTQWFGGLLGLITCKLFLANFVIPPVFSCWILVVIAVERFYAVARPLTSSPISQNLKKTIFLVWAWSFVSSANVIVNAVLVKSEEYYYCDFSTGWLNSHFILAAINSALPLLVIAVLYVIVCYKLWSREVPGEGTNQNQGQAEAIKTARKVTSVMIMVVVLYVLCWFPFDALYALNVLGIMEISPSLFTILSWLTVTYSAINPYIYLTFNQKFGNQLKHIFGNCFRKIKIHNALHFRSRSVELEQF
ncbi:hypothetical protein ACROYT_G003762 [Oculina patagonica]